MDENKISVKEYLDNKELLNGIYIPFDTKTQIVSRVVRGLVDSTGGIMSSILRRIFTEVVIESISNIDMNMD